MDNRNKKRVVVAMSGGVDSSVAAALLVQEGYEVVGITLRLWTPSPWNNGERYGGCCSPADIADAQQVCRELGIPHYTFNTEEKFKEKVVDNFVSEYLEGKTPNPCVRCNSFIKFDLLLKYALAMDADFLATGHYAKIEQADGFYHLAKAVDLSKDQSYFLYMLNQKQLSKVLFPIGVYEKNRVREIAQKSNLNIALKQDSQDVCFLEGRNYQEFIDERVDPEKIKKGTIQDKEGKVLGQHQGLPYYTIGQREKLGIATGQRLYVIEKDMETNTLVVGTQSQNLHSECAVHSVNWCSSVFPQDPVRALVKIRYRHAGVPATILVTSPTEAQVRFDAAQPSVTAGQSAVFYDNDFVLGGGIISAR